MSRRAKGAKGDARVPVRREMPPFEALCRRSWVQMSEKKEHSSVAARQHAQAVARSLEKAE